MSPLWALPALVLLIGGAVVAGSVARTIEEAHRLMGEVRRLQSLRPLLAGVQSAARLLQGAGISARAHRRASRS